MQRQSEERLILENKFLKDFRKLVNEYEEKVLKTYMEAVEKGTPTYNINVLLRVANQEFQEKYNKLLYKHLLRVERNAHNQTDELIQLQKKKRLGQKQEQVSFKELPITWLSLKAKDVQTTLNGVLSEGLPIPNKPYIVKENKPVKKYLKDHALTVSQKTAERIDKNIQNILTKSETEGINSRGVAEHITNKFKDLKTWEAERIARTEMNAANNLISHQRLLESDLVDYKQWITAQDHRVRGLKKGDKANHVIMNGEIARLGEPFSNGLQYPGDHNGPLAEFINCRCTIVPYIPDFDKIAPPNMTTFHEKDMQPLPTSTGQQITLQLQENQKLYKVMEGYMKLYPDKITVKPNKIQTTIDSFSIVRNTLDDILQTNRTKTKEVTISDETKDLFTKNRTHRKIKDIDKYVTMEQINKIYTEIKDQFPKEFSEQSIKEIIKIQQAFKKDGNEHGCVINVKNGKIFNQRDGKKSSVHITFSGINDMKNLASVHNHPIHGFNAPSDIDIDNMLHNPHEKYCVVVSESKIWIVKNKYHNIDLHDKNNSHLCVDCLDIVNGVSYTLEKNRVNELHEMGSIENINSIVDKEISEVFQDLNVYSKVIMICD